MTDPFESVQTQGIRRYAALVEQALGLDDGGHYVQPEPPASIYLPLRDRLARFPDRDVALIWDERHGWAVATENPGGSEFHHLAYLPDDLLPPPHAVAGWVDRLFSDDAAVVPTVPGPPGTAAADDLAVRLAGYATPEPDTFILTTPAR